MDPQQIPIQTLVQSFLTVMKQNHIKTFVAFLHDNQATIAMNHPDAEATARNLLSIKDGALEVAAAALHAFRFTDDPLDAALNFCSLHPCALMEKEAGHAVPWDELPQEVKEVHRLVAVALVSAALAHNPPKSKIVEG